MSDKLMLDFGDIEEVSEDESWAQELKSERATQAERNFQSRWKWLQFKGANWKRKKRRKKVGGNGTGSAAGNKQSQSANSNGSGQANLRGREARLACASR